jgi:hypothetical protein
MRRGIVASMLVLMVICAGATGNAHADRQAAVEQAKKAADAWLKLIDEGKYQESWSEAAAFFKDRITAERWAQMVGAVRKPLGALVSRDFKLAHYSTSVPGAPAGEYVVIQYDTSFANLKSAVETITPMLDKDGQWRVSGYYIKPN